MSRELLPRESVLIGTENSKRADWPLAVVEELIPSRDGRVRLMKLRTVSGILLRPLEIYDKGVPVPVPASVEVDREKELTNASKKGENCGPSAAEVFTRGGRKVKCPRFLT
jgi:hypothetical protein